MNETLHYQEKIEGKISHFTKMGQTKLHAYGLAPCP